MLLSVTGNCIALYVLTLGRLYHIFSLDSNLTTSVVQCLFVCSIFHIKFPCQLTLLVNQLSLSFDFSRQLTFLINWLSLSIDFTRQSTFLINQLSSSFNFPCLWLNLSWPLRLFDLFCITHFFGPLCYLTIEDKDIWIN